eukprot:CAMPEP_0194477534 /NCGR_PEP_ID=MMETSP0253-20130528/1263_1 /TAXON_ID=2966 /ORGANISM="Noctiluca scintillans" /LENGTH=127 /DNA_ID=CAMNT_0039316531 /DNA_START=61 /DNA_END=440 /DNA_ORIENTATION=-
MLASMLRLVTLIPAVIGVAGQYRSFLRNSVVGNSTVVDASCLTAAGCPGLGGCYWANTEFLKTCMVGRTFVFDDLVPHPVFREESCESLGFKPLTRTSTGTPIPDPCYGGWVSFYSNDEALFWNMYP